MNQCTFLGRLVSKELINESDTDKINLLLQIENKRKGKKDVKKMDYERLNFEAWGTAAISLEKNLTFDDYVLIIDSTARNNDGVINFRINEFKIIKREK